MAQKQGDFTYGVINVIDEEKTYQKESNYEIEEEEPQNRRNTLFGKDRVDEFLIGQFIDLDEGPDRDWDRDYSFDDFKSELNHQSQRINE